MSAIFGIYNIDGKPVSPTSLRKMSDVLSHRGPDGIGGWSDGGKIALGHAMLRVTPEARFEELPYQSPDKSYVITADVRLDNREELLGLGDLTGTGKEEITDSELILEAYQKWGVECPRHLLGDFAFAIWDGPQQKLFCARDHFGARPVYYHSAEKLFAFATEIKGLFALPEVPKRINESRLADYLSGPFQDEELTFFKNVFRLPPGHCLTVDKKGLRVSQYWRLELPPELRLKTDDEYAEALREQFTEAVKCRLRSSVPLGSMLSGGLDSSSITCMARKILAGENRPLHTFSAVFDEVEECDERHYINTVLRENSISPHFVVADKFGPFVDFDEILKVQDEPLYHSNFYLNWLSYKSAKARGIKVILDGFDGDNTISHGLGFFTELARNKRWGRLLLENVAYAKKTNQNWRRSAWSWIWFYGLNPWFSKNQFANRTQKFIRRAGKKIGLKDFAPQTKSSSGVVKLNAEFARRLKSEGYGPGNGHNALTERELHLQNLDATGNSFVLEVLNCAAGAHSLEVRFPFWDKRLIEFCLSLPPDQKIKRGWTRLVMRRAMADILPPEIQWRPGKTNMGPSFNFGLQKFGQKIMRDLIVQNPEMIVDYVDIKSVREAYRRFLDSDASVNDVLGIQRSVSLALWLQNQDLS